MHIGLIFYLPSISNSPERQLVHEGERVEGGEVGEEVVGGNVPAPVAGAPQGQSVQRQRAHRHSSDNLYRTTTTTLWEKKVPEDKGDAEPFSGVSDQRDLCELGCEGE